ncbi:DUF6193 family natural product biosynthesis protein [Streptomyces sp. NPDC003522]
MYVPSPSPGGPSVTDKNTPRSPRSAWTELLREFRPPHSESDPYTPAMWALLQVASRHPLLRTLYPELSTTMLTLSRTDDFHMREGERFPVIGAAAGEFGVCAYPVSENNILLITGDAEAAVSLAARLIEEQLDAAPPPNDSSSGHGS